MSIIEGEIAVIPDRVAKGIPWMDKRYPGWDTKINLDNFDMGSIFYGLIGYQHENTIEESTIAQWSIPDDMFIEGGITYAYMVDRKTGQRAITKEEFSQYIDALTKEWVREINRRRDMK